MANPSLFGRLFPGLAGPVTRNHEGAPAYSRPAGQALAQLAATGCLNATFYATAEAQLRDVLELAAAAPTEFVAKTAVYARERGFMKDMPAVLVAALSRRDAVLMDRVFDRVIDTPRMLRTFVQIVRSGKTGRKSLGSAPKRCVRRWLDQRTDAAIFAASVGEEPSLADVLKLVHPKPATPAREALYGYVLGRQMPSDRLPAAVAEFEAFKRDRTCGVPDVPFQMLTGLTLSADEWTAVARRASWHTTRMNLNTFARHGVFGNREVTTLVADRLRDEDAIARAKVFPYQVLAAYRNVDPAVPAEIVTALGEAMELAIANVPVLPGKIYVCPDVSGSMQSPVTGRRTGATTTVRCLDVAALIAATVVRKNRSADVLAFDWNVHTPRFNPFDAVTTNADRFAALGGGGTAVSAPLTWLNRRGAAGDLVILVSDNESWIDKSVADDTTLVRQWNEFRRRNPPARLVLLDLQPNLTTQAMDRDDILNIGGFSDRVFDVLAAFAAGRLGNDHWVGEIDQVAL